MLYQLSYFRSCMASSAGGQAPFGSANIRAYSDSSKLFRQKISLSSPFSDTAFRVGASGSPTNQPGAGAIRQSLNRPAEFGNPAALPPSFTLLSDGIRETSPSRSRIISPHAAEAHSLAAPNIRHVGQSNPVPMKSGSSANQPPPV